MWGRRDRIIPVEHAQPAHNAMPGSRLEIFGDAGHFPHCEAPERFVETLAFLAHVGDRIRVNNVFAPVQPALPHAQLTASICPAGLATAAAVLATSAIDATVQAGSQPGVPRRTRTDPAVIASAMTSHMAPWKANEA